MLFVHRHLDHEGLRDVETCPGDVPGVLSEGMALLDHEGQCSGWSRVKMPGAPPWWHEHLHKFVAKSN